MGGGGGRGGQGRCHLLLVRAWQAEGRQGWLHIAGRIAAAGTWGSCQNYGCGRLSKNGPLRPQDAGWQAMARSTAQRSQRSARTFIVSSHDPERKQSRRTWFQCRLYTCRQGRGSAARHEAAGHGTCRLGGMPASPGAGLRICTQLLQKYEPTAFD